MIEREEAIDVIRRREQVCAVPQARGKPGGNGVKNLN
jgi:hypothetical protein